MVYRLAVIGAGPKGAAIAAKAEAMRVAGIIDAPEITLFDTDGPGAAWSGNHGYTDGQQPLCTLAERDLGFPYDRFDLGAARSADVAAAMQALFSWQAFCVAEGLADTRYDLWVLKGRKPPSHADFARYLEFAIHRSRAHVVQERVIGIDHDGSSGEWLVKSTADGSTMQPPFRFDGVVMTGSGSPVAALPGAGSCPRVFDARDFWDRTLDVETFLRGDDDPAVIIIGAGGAGAAISHWFVRSHHECPITIVGFEPTLYARQSGFFEERLFTDLDAWDALPDHAKDDFLRHTTAGVVWDSVLREITRNNIQYRCCAAVSIAPRPGLLPGMAADYCLITQDAPDQLRNAIEAELRAAGVPVPVRTSPVPTPIDGTIFIDARGFNRLSFIDEMGLAKPLANQIRGQAPRWFEQRVDRSFALDLPTFPKGFHLPMLGSRRGPGATNLMALGWIADRVLSAY